MSRPQIRRVVTTDVVAERDKLLAYVNKTIGASDSPVIRIIDSPKRDYAADYRDRFHSFCHSALFLLDALPKDFPTMNALQQSVLSKAITQLRDKFSIDCRDALRRNTILSDVKKPEIDVYQNILREKSLKLVALFMSQFGVSKTTASEYLSLAEKYYLLQNTRADLVTISPLNVQLDVDDSRIYYVIQRENPLPPLPDAVVEDLWMIKTSDGTRAMPRWYNVLEPIEQYLIVQALDAVGDKSEINEKLGNLSSRLRTLPGVANFRLHEMYLLDDKGELLDKSSSLASSMVSSRDVLSKGAEVSLFHSVNNIKRIVLSRYQDLLYKKLQLMQASLSDGRTVHLPLNMLLQTLITPISLAPTPDAGLCDDKEKAIIHASAELKTFFGEPKEIEIEGKKIRVQVDFNILSTNHPLNIGDKIISTTSDDAGCLKVLETIQKYHDSAMATVPQKEKLATLMKEYQERLDDTSWISWYWDPAKRELTLSSLEQLMFDVMNDMDYGSCVSGKDRKALELLHTDAMKIYYDIYGTYYTHELDPVCRQRFVSIFAQLYLTRHHHDSAALNAPGARGTKTPAKYLPSDIQQEITRQMELAKTEQPHSLRDDDKVASNNDFSKVIGDSKLVRAGRSGFNKAAKMVRGLFAPSPNTEAASESRLMTWARTQLSGINRQISQPQPIESKSMDAKVYYCLQLLKDIVGNKGYWEEQGSSVASLWGGAREPDGVVGLRGVLCCGEISGTTLTAIYQQVIQRSIACGTRGAVTENLYQIIQQLYLFSDKAHVVSSLREPLDKLYDTVLHRQPTYAWPTSAEADLVAEPQEVSQSLTN